MHAMFSAENEKVNFTKFVDPVHKNVEDWMNEVENEMKCSVRYSLIASVDDYYSRKRVDWCRIHPG